MGVYLSNINMPTNCGECLLAKLSQTGESLICNYMLSRVSWEERPFDCPLIPVPSHGDLIDRVALMQHEVLLPRDGGSMPIVYSSYIRNAPTIIQTDESNMDSFIHIFEEDDEEDGMDSFIRILKD